MMDVVRDVICSVLKDMYIKMLDGNKNHNAISNMDIGAHICATISNHTSFFFVKMPSLRLVLLPV